MDKSTNTGNAFLRLYLNCGVVDLKGNAAIEIYEYIKTTIQTLEHNPSQVRYTKEVKQVDGSIFSLNVNLLSGYTYNEDIHSPKEQADQTLNQLNENVDSLSSYPYNDRIDSSEDSSEDRLGQTLSRLNAIVNENKDK